MTNSSAVHYLLQICLQILRILDLPLTIAVIVLTLYFTDRLTTRIHQAWVRDAWLTVAIYGITFWGCDIFAKVLLDRWLEGPLGWLGGLIFAEKSMWLLATQAFPSHMLCILHFFRLSRNEPMLPQGVLVVDLRWFMIYLYRTLTSEHANARQMHMLNSYFAFPF